MNYINENITKYSDEELITELNRYFNNLNGISYPLDLDKIYYKKEWIINGEPKGKDKAGCYVLSYKDKDMYVGISRGIFKRMKQHLSENEKSATFKKKLDKYQSLFNTRPEINAYPKDFKFRYVEITDNYLLAMFEIYASMKLETFWNTFKTH